VALDVCKELVKKGHDVEVYTTNAYDQKSNFKSENRTVIMSGIKVTYFSNVLRLSNLYIAPRMITEMRKSLKNFDVIHVHFGRQPYDAYIGLTAVKFGVPYVIQAHGCLTKTGKRKILKSIFDTFLGRKILRNSTKTIALNNIEAEQYRSMGVSEEKIAIVPNGIDLSEYAELPPKGVFKKKFNIPEDKKIILYLGRIHKIKGIDFLVRAYAHLINEMNFKDAILVIAGPDDGYLGEVKSLVQGLDISNTVLFTGPLYGKDKISAYVDSEVYVLPSRYETFPMTVLEAYACGKPVITSKIGGLKDLVMNGETGLLFEPGNVEQLARNILYLLNDNGEAKEMGLKGKEFVKENLTIESVVTKLEKVYEEIVEAR